MIDLHCHYLPGIDDGAPTLQAGLALARAAVANGIRCAVLTPHVFPGRWNNSLSVIRPIFANYRTALRDADIDLDVRLGGEVHLLPESLEWLDRGELPFLGGWHGNPVVLLEFPDGHVPAGALQAARYLLKCGVTPMIAHPERNRDVMRSFRKIEPFVREGCLLQLTAASVCGWFGAAAHRTALDLLDAGWVTVVATDSHNLVHRPPVLAEARYELTARFDAVHAQALTRDNPAEIVGARGELGMDD